MRVIFVCMCFLALSGRKPFCVTPYCKVSVRRNLTGVRDVAGGKQEFVLPISISFICCYKEPAAGSTHPNPGFLEGKLFFEWFIMKTFTILP